MKRFAVGYESLCRIIMMIVVVNVAFVAHTLPGLMMVFGVAVLIFATMMAVYSVSYTHLPRHCPASVS